MSSDPNPQGGDLSEMAVEGTTVPEDSATQRIISSVPRPDQIADSSNDPTSGSSTLTGAADNAGDISRVRFDFLLYLRPFSWKRNLFSSTHD